MEARQNADGGAAYAAVETDWESFRFSNTDFAQEMRVEEDC
jgi:hypothetical protein